uniref:Uncharacterized protein n=1 Tax=Setaria italica TaxID=4555 RepID=K3XP73_SETIT
MLPIQFVAVPLIYFPLQIFSSIGFIFHILCLYICFVQRLKSCGKKEYLSLMPLHFC